MPNHVTHRLTIKGTKENIDKMIANHFTFNDRTGGIDFNKIIPMPECLKNSESSGNVTMGLALLNKGELERSLFLPLTAEHYLDHHWVKQLGIKTVEELKDYIAKEKPEILIAGQKAIDNYEATGHTSWYTWSNANWGTKWEAYSQNFERIDDETVELCFDTAWGTPDPVLEKLSELNPDLEIEVYLVKCKPGNKMGSLQPKF